MTYARENLDKFTRSRADAVDQTIICSIFVLRQPIFVY